MKKFTEQVAAKYITTILETVDFIHGHDIAHRDLKPNNIVFDKPGDEGKLKLIDFGDAIIIKDDEESQHYVGTLHYFTPEMLDHRNRKGREIKKGDIYSVGVITYVLLTGCFPFSGNNQKEVKQSIARGCAQIKW
eukprot:291109_1